MARVLIVVAHPGSKSFTHDWAGASADGARDAGHEVDLCDLYGERFDPVERFDGADVSEHVARLKAADQVIFHFPLWWYGPPAIVKGWIDRVLVQGETYDMDARFEDGPLAGKRALFCVSAGVSAVYCGPSGQGGDARLQLWPLAHALRFAGITVLEPYLVPGIDSALSPAQKILMEAQAAQVLRDQPGRVAAMERLPVWATNPSSDFTEEGALKPGAPVFSPFIRHDDGAF